MKKISLLFTLSLLLPASYARAGAIKDRSAVGLIRLAQRVLPRSAGPKAFKVVTNRGGKTHPLILLPGPRQGNEARRIQDRDLIRQHLLGGSHADTLVEFFKLPRARTGGFHHLFVAMRMPDPATGQMKDVVFSRSGDANRGSGEVARLIKDPAAREPLKVTDYRVAENTTERYSLFVRLSPSQMKEVRAFFSSAADKKLSKETIGVFDVYAGTGDLPHASGCTSYVAGAKAISGGKTRSLARILGLKSAQHNVAAGFMDDLRRNGNVVAEVIHNSQWSEREAARQAFEPDKPAEDPFDVSMFYK